jgi:hypothetical protein
MAVCRGNEPDGRLWAGYWANSGCMGAFASGQRLATRNIQFLTVTSGPILWVTGLGPRPTPGSIGTLPPNTLDAGANYQGTPQILCSIGGYVGWVTQNLCMVYAPGRISMRQNATVLVSQGTPVYTWTSAAAPPSNAVTAPDTPRKAACRGNGQYGRLWAGYWNGTQCIGSYANETEVATANIQFLTVVWGSIAQWVSGSGKTIPGDIGTLPANTIDAGSTYTGLPQILCSRGGYTGWVYQNQCQIVAPGLSGQQNATVLVGTVQ